MAEPLVIEKFADTMETLSPAFNVNATWEGKVYPTMRHALHVVRFQDVIDSPETIKRLAKMSIEDLNQLEAGMKPKRYWDMLSTPALYKLLKDRYRRHTGLRKYLFNTGEHNIIIRAPAFGQQSDERLLGVYGMLLTKIRGEIQAGELDY